jgi:hypothetical protein
MRDWQQKVYDFSEKAKTSARKEGNAAEKELNAAWATIQVEAQKLKTASAEGWERKGLL